MKSKVTFLALALLCMALAYTAAYLIATRLQPQPTPEIVAVAPANTPLAPLPEIDFQEDPKRTWLTQLRAADHRDFPRLYALCESQGAQDHQSLLVHLWSHTDPESFLAFLLEDPPFFRNEPHGYHLFREWAGRDFDHALEAAHALSPFNPMRSTVLRGVVRGGMERNPEKALGALTEIYANAGSSGILRDVESPEHYLPILQKLPRGNLIHNEIERAVHSWATHDPAAALQWLQSDVDALDSKHRVNYAISDLARHDHEAALEAFRNIASTERRGSIARNIAESIAEADPQLAVTWLENEVDGWYQVSAAAEAANELAESDPTLGADFAIRFNEPQLRARAVHEALKVFHDRDTDGMHRWASGVTDPTARKVVRAEIDRLTQRR